jgi:PhnB protein
MSVTAYLNVADAQAAIRFYQEALGAVERFRLPAEDGRKTMHAELEIAGGQVFLSDMSFEKPAGVGLAVGLEKAAEVDTLVARMKAAGATVAFGPEDMFWGDRFAELTDPFGHTWLLTAPKDA